MEAGTSAPTCRPARRTLSPAPDPTGGRESPDGRPADPGPLGLAAFAGTTFVLSLINAGLVGEQEATPVAACCRWSPPWRSPTAAPPSCWRGSGSSGPVTRSARSRSARTERSGSRSSSSFSRSEEHPDRGVQRARPVPVDVGHLHDVHVHRLATHDSGAVALVFLLLAITFIVLGIGNAALAGTTNVINGTIKLGGYLGILTAIAAWYASFAAVINSTFARIIAPGLPAQALTTRSHQPELSGVQIEKRQPRMSRPARAPAATAGARR